MANQRQQPGPGDVADERGRFEPEAMPGEPAMVPDPDPDATAEHPTVGDAPPTRRIGTQGAAISDLADPDADANSPDPSKPITMGVGSGPDRSRAVPGGGYGDSRDVDDSETAAINDEEAGPRGGVAGEPLSGSHLSEDDTKGPPDVPVEHPSVAQPANVAQPRRP